MQSYANHRQRPLVLFSICVIFLLNFLWKSYLITRGLTVDAVLSALTAGALLLLPFVLRRLTLRVQDRLIRLEMRLRLKETLPSALYGQIAQVGLRHLVALRFASDAELPSLVEHVLANPSVSANDLKQRITNWQPATLRA